MRILTKTRSGQLEIHEVPEATTTADGNIVIHKSGITKKYLTGESTEKVFNNLLVGGYADLSEFESERYRSETLL